MAKNFDILLEKMSPEQRESARRRAGEIIASIEAAKAAEGDGAPGEELAGPLNVGPRALLGPHPAATPA